MVNFGTGKGSAPGYEPVEDDSTPPETTAENGDTFHVEMEELEEGGRFETFSKVTLAWKDVHVSASLDVSPIDRCKGNKATSKHLLNGVSGVVEPGQFVAIMGASGAGKTTLLNTLACRNGPQITTTGEVTVNGKTCSQSQIKRISAYVQQDDNFVSTLTVKEIMMFHANLRMDPAISDKNKETTVESILQTLGLSHTSNTLVGSTIGPVRGISGGERKRLSVATELLMDPPLLFIDEPTSGLDSFMAENVVSVISKLAKANRTVLCTIHQPASEVFSLFDRVCLVSEGEIAYLGDTHSVLQHFERAGYPCNPNYNPADHYIFTLAIRPGLEDSCRERAEHLIKLYKESETYTAMWKQLDIASEDVPEVQFRKPTGSTVGRQVIENLKRSIKNVVRNPAYIRSRIMQSIIVGLLMGLAYLNTRNDQHVAQNKSGALFNLIVYFTFGNIVIQTMSIPGELHIVRREYQNGMYTTLPYFLSKILAEIPYLFGLSLITMAVCYFMIGFKCEFLAFLTTVIGIAGISWCGTGLGWFLSTWTGDAAIAGALTAPIIMPLFLFGGLYQNEQSTPVYFEPVKYMSWFRYGFNMLMVNEFSGLQNITCSESIVSDCSFHSGEDVLRYFAIQDSVWWPNMLALILIGGFLCLFAWSCLICRLRRR